MMEDEQSAKKEHVNFTSNLKGTIEFLKGDVEEKFQTINVHCPKVWEVRRSMKERAKQYSRRSMDREFITKLE